MAKSPDVGTTAPDFTLPSVTLRDGTAQRADLTLSQQRGSTVVLVFYPGDETSVCTKQLCSYTSELGRFTDLGATVWAISPQDLDSHESFARKERLGFPLLADTDRAVVRSYGIGLPGLGLRRSVFVIDADGILRWKHVALVGLTYPDAATIAGHLPAHSEG
ncbi:peroxiredoxin family protein [Actinomadura scrupuli]|uniref:peroxiredoxin family protein n=1 Tax=Actinomadura scrupuli TaxID=559629 RepID=UPI003D95FC13